MDVLEPMKKKRFGKMKRALKNGKKMDSPAVKKIIPIPPVINKPSRNPRGELSSSMKMTSQNFRSYTLRYME